MGHVFISYAHTDVGVIDRLADSLKQSNLEVWLDREGIHGGAEWRTQIVDAIKKAEVFLVALSPDSVKSRNVRKELAVAENWKIPILPLVVRQSTIPEDMEYTLAELQRVDISDDFPAGLGRLLRALSELRKVRTKIRRGGEGLERKRRKLQQSVGKKEQNATLADSPLPTIDSIKKHIAEHVDREIQTLAAEREEIVARAGKLRGTAEEMASAWSRIYDIGGADLALRYLEISDKHLVHDLSGGGMNSALMKRRDALLARSDAALDRWPDRTGPAFTAEMSAVAEGLEALAQAVARPGKDALEVSRTWRFAGNAYFDLGAGRERAPLERAAAAYHSAEALLEGLADRVELVKLNYCFGKTLLQLSDARDLSMASAARERLKTALALARNHMPASVALVEKEVANAEQIVSLLTQADGLTQLMSVLQRKVERIDHAADITELFGVLQQQFEKEKPSLDPIRQAELSDLMHRLKGVVERGTSENQTLEDMNANRGQLYSMMNELWAQEKKPSLKGAGTPADSRNAQVLAALQELKMFVVAAGMNAATPMGMRDEARDLFVRIARLTTAINRAGTDAATVRQLEYDQARGLGNEVRLFSRRSHLMLARPVWPRWSSAVDANRVFLSGSHHVRASLARVCEKVGLELVDATPAGADFAVDRWQGLRTSSVAVFDLAEEAPQVYYELGIALTLGTQLLLLSSDDVDIPFDIAQNVNTYCRGGDVDELLAQQLDVACYGLQARGGESSGLKATLAYAEQLAASDHGNALLGVALKSLRSAGDDPVKFNDALKLFNTYLGGDEHEVLLPRWPGSYPDPTAPRWFAVMPFRGEREPAYEVMREAAKRSGIEPVRGDTAEGQEIIESIWQEICQATRVTVDLSGFNLNVCLELGIAHTLGRPVVLVGEKGTAQRMAAALPSVAKWRCHTYEADPRSRPEFQTALQKFFAQSS